jgi:tRNA A22 N-methylase
VEDASPRERARDAFSKLANRGKSWKRLRHLVELACLCDEERALLIADIGCDHGLLSLGLAASGRFDRVVGVDISEQALTDGGIAILNRMMTDIKMDKEWKHLSSEDVGKLFPVDFCIGDGLRVLEPAQAYAVCVAGMGVDTMIRILNPIEVDRVGCEYLILQPTNTRPRNLIRLYDFLADTGWTVEAERIEYLSSRWYISFLFTRLFKPSSPVDNDKEKSIPGQLLSTSEEESTRTAYNDWVQHHRRWIVQDSVNTVGSMDENDRRWLNATKEQDNTL